MDGQRTERRRRNSLRLKGFDYSQPGEYFITICTADRLCILGEIVGASMQLSEPGKLVELCWRKIPDHFPTTRVDVFQIMPNHIHGIIQIKEKTRMGEVSSPVRVTPPMMDLPGKGDGTSPPRDVRLRDIVAYFKFQATKQMNEMTGTPGRRVFQRSYYDHIIRDDVDHFFVERYIELNPIMWQLDVNNPQGQNMSIEQITRLLREEHGFDDDMVERLLERKGIIQSAIHSL